MLDTILDNVVHGSPYSPPEAEDYDLLFLDSDGYYKVASKIKNEEIQTAIENCLQKNLYALSRALAVEEANSLSKTKEAKPIIEE